MKCSAWRDYSTTIILTIDCFCLASLNVLVSYFLNTYLLLLFKMKLFRRCSMKKGRFTMQYCVILQEKHDGNCMIGKLIYAITLQVLHSYFEMALFMI